MSYADRFDIAPATQAVTGSFCTSPTGPGPTAERNAITVNGKTYATVLTRVAAFAVTRSAGSPIARAAPRRPPPTAGRSARCRRGTCWPMPTLARRARLAAAGAEGAG
jgi:hypothetical protein